MFVENSFGQDRDYLDGINSATDNSPHLLEDVPGPGQRICVVTLILDNTSAVDTHVDILSGSKQKVRIPVPRGSGSVINFPRPLELFENDQLNFQATVGVTTLTVSFVGFKK